MSQRRARRSRVDWARSLQQRQLPAIRRGRRPEERMKTKSVLLALLVPFLFAASVSAETLEKVKVVIPQNSVFILNWMGARDAGIFKKHGIDIEIDPRPFAAFL